MLIYQAKNLITGKIYVGKTVGTLESRRRGHLRRAQEGSETAFHRSIRKHGAGNFEFSILEECLPNVDLNQRERFYIATLDCMSPKGYNLTPGGDGHSKGWKNPNKGKSIIPESSRVRIRAARALQVITDETRRKISIANQGKHSTPKGPSPKKGIPSGVSAWNKGLVGFLAGRPAWNKGLTKENHPAVALQAQKMNGKIAWNKGLTKDTDERVNKYASHLTVSDSNGIFKKGHEPWNKGIAMVHSDDSNRKRSETMRGKPKSEETKERMRLAQATRRAAERKQNR